MNNIGPIEPKSVREILESIVAPEHPWFDPKKAVDQAELAINKMMEAKFKENYKRLAEVLIGEDESTTIVFKATSPNDPPDKLLLERRLKRNELRTEQRATLSDQLNNMKGE